MYANHLIAYGDAPSFRDTLLSPQVMGPPRPSASSAVAAAMLWRMPTAFCTFSAASNWGAKSRPRPRSCRGPWSDRFRQALPQRCDILPEGLIGGPIRPRQREQNRHQHVGEHRRDGDVSRPRRIVRLEKRSGVSAATVKLGREIVSLGRIASANGADRRIVSVGSFHTIP